MSNDPSDRLYMHLGETERGEPVRLLLSALRKHVLAVGGSGSGKSVFGKVVAEEALRFCLPTICVDTQGDLVAMARRSSKVPEGAIAPLDITRSKLDQRMEPIIWTPGSTLGIPLSMAPSLSIPDGLSSEDRARTIGMIAADIANFLGDRSEATVVGLHELLDHADRSSYACGSLKSLSNWLSNPPADLADKLEPLIGKRRRRGLVKTLAVKRSGVNRLLYELGQPIDPYELFGQRQPGPAWEGRARLSIIYLGHLNHEEQQEFMAVLLSSLYRWALTLNGDLQGLVFIDEIAPFCPPVAKPPAKSNLMLLLRQARKFGLGCVLATQSPGDVDYRALGQIGTLALGRLADDAGLARLSSVLRPRSGNRSVIPSLAMQSPGTFTLVSPDHFDGPKQMKSRWLATAHRLVSESEIAGLVSDDDRVRLGGAVEEVV